MKALLVGGGAREHAIAKRLAESSTLVSVMKNRNPGIAQLAKSVLLEAETNVERVVEFALGEKVDFVFVGPEAPLEKGLADALEAKGVPCVGASQKAALIETNKLYCRQFIQDAGIGCNPDFSVFDNASAVEAHLKKFEKAVVKPLGLTGGKGVKIMGEVSQAEAIEYAKGLIAKDSRVLVEEFLEGEEFSLQALVSGGQVLEMPLVQDHKRAYDGDLGQNTGGMGSYSDSNHLLPFVSLSEKNYALDAMKKTARALAEKGTPFKGVLYGQFMLTRGGPKLVEYNARFADPESMNVLSLLQSDFTELCWAVIDGRLSQKHADFERKASVVKYAVPEGYPSSPLKDFEIAIDENKIEGEGGEIFYANVFRENGKLVGLGSRNIAILGKGKSIEEAEEISEKCVASLGGRVFHRKDIGTRELVQKRVEHMKKVRGGF